MLFKHVGNNVSTEMVVTTSSQMAGSKNLLVLDVLVGNGKHLCAKSELAQCAGHRVVG